MRNLIFVLVLLFSPSYLFSGEPDKKLHSECLYPTVTVVAKNINMMGTGVIVRSEKISDNLYHNVVITCSHIIRKGEDYEVVKGKYKDWSKLEGACKYDCEVYETNRLHDLGVVIFSSEDKMPVATLDFDTKLFIGNKVFRIGCGLNDEPRLDYGRITSLNGIVGNIKNSYRTSIPTVPGDSGGPVFHNYKVIGIMAAIRSLRFGWIQLPVFNISYVLPITRYKIWDKELNGAISFVYDKAKKLPVMSYFIIKLKSKEINKKVVPANHWEKK